MTSAALKPVWRYCRNVLVGFDQFLNALTGGAPDETISYRAAVAAERGDRAACLFCGFLSLFERRHCAIVFAKRNTRALPGSS